MKIASVVGVRPQFVKASVVSRELRKTNEECLIHTGQHYDYEMNKVFFEELGIPEPNYYLGVGSGSHGQQTGEMLRKLEEVLLIEKPDLVLTYGDTNSTLAGALAASKLGIKNAHVESGLRSFDRSMPEEINRILTDHCSNILFCPTQNAVDNLREEGITENVYLTGDVMVDSLLLNKEIAEAKSSILTDLNLKNRDYLVATIHRASNTDNIENLQNIIEAFQGLDENIIFPVHPRTEKLLRSYGLYESLSSSVTLTKPLGFLDFIKLMNHAKMILTDSGGVQKEAYILKVPCVTLRENTEWIETIRDGWNVLVGSNKNKIIEAVNEFMPLAKEHRNRFGDGSASNRIAATINGLFGNKSASNRIAVTINAL
ncbi:MULTISPECIES: non-hydrolyzing UDP-N-acetylglucosamine 2-epimerase [Methanosarcina]|uniref:UDP-N-acetylglucosamine 2-epimerase n=2 Tax=Methanosarcina barkeri TaxID=2208 RepID=A0A0E3QQN5_METBA|nr:MULTISPECIES: UDP-N-acetylglucosamine 2-epimerase (non-hydrolyzing) [Methanosarcina]AKB53003.1 UDP-N-acetylglucosamine 2-epimerase [Methanosarcina barkeri MS]AKB56534.1 UDP-N-acetylglucosamine 2-epimerase [Methanosarcina barkeri 227]OEC89775.1 UDP-N-acetylglucosamine 2-epimerase [Methanosarcina sp. A14]